MVVVFIMQHVQLIHFFHNYLLIVFMLFSWAHIHPAFECTATLSLAEFQLVTYLHMSMCIVFGNQPILRKRTLGRLN